MAIKCTSVNAEKNVLMLEYVDTDSGLFTCSTEYEVDLYTAVAANGKNPFAVIRPAQWRAICREVLATFKPKQRDKVFRCIIRYASAPAVEIFTQELRKAITRQLKSLKKTSDTPEQIREKEEQIFNTFLQQFDCWRQMSLDDFASKYIRIPVYSLDDLADVIAA